MNKKKCLKKDKKRNKRSKKCLQKDHKNASENHKRAKLKNKKIDKIRYQKNATKKNNKNSNEKR